jgi:hypothetical protein
LQLLRLCDVEVQNACRSCYGREVNVERGWTVPCRERRDLTLLRSCLSA